MTSLKLKTNINGLNGKITIPGDKSISHRSVMFGSIAYGETKVTNFLPGEDCLSTISCFRKLGVTIEESDNQLRIIGKGFEGLTEPTEVLDVGNSGTTIRLLMGILAGRPFFSSLVGDESIGKRPMTRVTNPLSEIGARIDGRKEGSFTPISIRGGGLKPVQYQLPVASAQVKSALILAGLQAEGQSIIIEPEETRDHTERMIKKFGGEIHKDNQKIMVKGGQKLTGTAIHVPGDISSAAFFLVAGAVIPDSEIVLKNVGLNPTRTGIIEVMKKMGADLEIVQNEETSFEPFGDLIIKTSSLKGTVIEGDLIPKLIDEIPIIALLATQAEGTTIIKDAEELKVKETNRIDTVVNELKKLGAKIEATEDGMIIYGKSVLSGGTVSSHGDHRIGMMLAIAALLCENEAELVNPEAISVSYPNFFAHLNSLIK
ncbi:3-phosphoshikimate 1-carboxyvinyltransferase [Bacillus sp. ISL-40]|uniref:3-phosphoshikimate 1-carboxyvinyltransferase n=1 Tax=unclassified Bacillus (in: firmicutes) TaxID=185979 RepID=UPI001BE96B19|nr:MULTISPECIES: 3-phosphoshikimate 1-carboxyvinyltransferase [unclassified Bacillus (in: firmicutes)]MBT2701456.1 3-phosphoshikimate 1-carboxyvinyltransferase [Bacillus sp. ISL-40]MBT2743391.1 3-phosphoshikimate 1-carboxyvinyltransferase [Bacillus sp. ISL-77]